MRPNEDEGDKKGRDQPRDRRITTIRVIKTERSEPRVPDRSDDPPSGESLNTANPVSDQTGERRWHDNGMTIVMT